ncbi:MAG TPA: cytochrome c [Alphaproteobacteria bacterium]|jgi:mono/diheme cytochrome c family protein
MKRRSTVWTALGIAAALGIVAVVGLFILARQPELSAIATPDPASFDKAVVERGRVLANYGDCSACHTREDGAPFAGNLPLPTPFGIIYTSNITPDPDSGIGNWSKDAFRRALKEGVDRKGNHLYPAFPYDHFTKVKEADVDAIYAYLMAGVAPVKETVRKNELPFPFNVRQVLYVWKALFLDKTPFKPDPAKDEQWNDGAYLVEGLGHCGACHTPRNFMGAETSPAYGGGAAEGWVAPPLNKDSLSQMPWTRQELVVYLMDGWHAKHGMAAGPMTPVVNALHNQNEIDVFAIAAYVESLRAGAPQIDEDKARAAALKREWGNPEAPPVPTEFAAGAKVFEARCAQCHKANGGALPLALQTSVNAKDPGTVVHAIWSGIRPPVGALGRSMPAIGPQLTEAEMSALVKFVRARYTDRPAWSGVDKAVKDARQGK